MSECTDSQMGILIHGYEIGILSEPECEQFEMHLLECERCSDLLNAFERPASLLITSKKVRAAIDETVAAEDGSESFISRIGKHLWPRVPFVFKPAVVYIVVILLAIPAYQGLRGPEKETVREFGQAIHLSPTRGALKALKKGTSDNALLTFQFDGYQSGRAYGVVIESENSIVIYSNSEFSSFDEREIGSLNLTISEIRPGKYHLIVSDPQSDSTPVFQRYLFLIEE